MIFFFSVHSHIPKVNILKFLRGQLRSDKAYHGICSPYPYFFEKQEY